MLDHFGLLISAVITSGNCGDRNGLEALLYFSKGNYHQTIFADQGYCGTEFHEQILKYGVNLQTVKRRDNPGFMLEARRWIVERTFAWLGKCRRLSKDYELMTKSSLSMLYLSMIRLVLRRIVAIC